MRAAYTGRRGGGGLASAPPRQCHARTTLIPCPLAVHVRARRGSRDTLSVEGRTRETRLRARRATHAGAACMLVPVRCVSNPGPPLAMNIRRREGAAEGVGVGGSTMWAVDTRRRGGGGVASFVACMVGFVACVSNPSRTHVARRRSSSHLFCGPQAHNPRTSRKFRSRPAPEQERRARRCQYRRCRLSASTALPARQPVPLASRPRLGLLSLAKRSACSSAASLCPSPSASTVLMASIFRRAAGGGTGAWETRRVMAQTLRWAREEGTETPTAGWCAMGHEQGGGRPARPCRTTSSYAILPML
ncbi:hypothetical protein B0H15DRAFT_863345 [Mycena belliarum]|uniref:Uncharacterized protein n=1 Tax=Mycena belliarum TaxID=1033014 RepID=A0AAD6TUE3_9AGAR|nr:hypothetical protein B0H15DRAFT_863345 [Mycena belliae]